VIFTVFLLYPLTSKKTLAFFLCKLVEGKSYFVEDFRYQCFDDQWNRWLPYALVCVMVYPIGISLVFFFLLLKRNYLTAKYQALSFLHYSSFLTGSYTSRRYWWELMDMTFKLIMTSIIQFLPTTSIIIGAIAVTGSYLICLLMFSPFKEGLIDQLQLLSTVEILILAMMSHTTQQDVLVPGSAIDVLLSILCISVVVLLFIAMVLVILVHLRTSWHGWRRKLFLRDVSDDSVSSHPLEKEGSVHGNGNRTEPTMMEDNSNYNATDEEPQEPAHTTALD